MKNLLRRFVRGLAAPFAEVFSGLESCLEGGPRELLVVMVGLLLGWWVYVPLHELLHALGCLATGGEVTRLEVGTIYGGPVLAAFIPWVVSGSEYAGRLSGFSTHGNDLIYLATDLAPYLLTIWPGVWAMRLAVRSSRSWLYGAMLSWALAPFISLTGDAYEIGSILVTRLVPWSSVSARELIRGDDLLLLPERMQGASTTLWLGAALAILAGLVWAYAWWWIASEFGRLAGQERLEFPPVESGPSE